MIAGSWIPGAARSGTAQRCAFLYRVCGNIIAIRDGDAARPVWDGACDVLAVLVRRGFNLDQFRIIYRDSDEGLWHGLRVIRENGEQRFAGCYPIGERDLDDAVARVQAGAR